MTNRHRFAINLCLSEWELEGIFQAMDLAVTFEAVNYFILERKFDDPSSDTSW